MSSKSIRQFLCLPIYTGVFIFFISGSEAKTFQVQIIEQPTGPSGYFTGKIVSADYDDPTPNYCYQKSGCYYAGFANSKAWGEAGLSGYSTTDTGSVLRSDAAKKGKTMGEVARLLRDSGSLSASMKDYLPSHYGRDPTFCVYAKTTGQVAGTLVSNCADAPVSPSSCKLSPENLTFDWGMLTNTVADEIELSRNLKVTCTKPTNVRLSISGEYISLNADSRTRAEFNLGTGWTGSTEINVTDSADIQMKSRLRGLNDREGVYSGSTILVFEQI